MRQRIEPKSIMRPTNSNKNKLNSKKKKKDFLSNFKRTLSFRLLVFIWEQVIQLKLKTFY